MPEDSHFVELMARTKKTARKLYPEEQNPQKSQGNVLEKHSKKRVKYHVKSLREVRRAQKYVGLLIPRLPFMRVVKQITTNLCSLMKTSSFINVRWQTQALLCLQEAVEDFAIDFMNDAYLCSAHSHRVTLMVKDYVISHAIHSDFHFTSSAEKLLKMHIDQNFPRIAKLNDQKQFGYIQIHVPSQKDAMPCGWRVIANVVRFLERRFYSPDLNLSYYPDAWIILIREREQ
ncbi:hypothetical protein KP509_21G020000 [Ceratopteris richardii]|uniref:Core Histone H2A/H2B/H3 domain-containing protein n=1 Tax=Ceratopteris richardii TaxID=49495 RepID=A0A8T2SBF2_CERRI|nr:hypothetical protein KP509_21G020000 [Ceratopteris richardii]